MKEFELKSILKPVLKLKENVKMGIHISDVFSYKLMNGLKV